MSVSVELQNLRLLMSVRFPMQNRYCCMKSARAFSGQVPIARIRGRYFTCGREHGMTPA